MFRMAVASLMMAAAALTAQAGIEEMNPLPDPAAVIVSGNARFTVLTPRLIRMELCGDAKFEDRASYAFINRKQPVPKFETTRKDGWLTIQTESLTLRYKENSAAFTAESLQITWKHGNLAGEWRVGQENKGNLLGTYRTLDGVSGDSQLEPGILSRDGWTLVDDSQRVVFTPSDATSAHKSQASAPPSPEGSRRDSGEMHADQPTTPDPESDNPKSKIQNPKSAVDWRSKLTNQDFDYGSPWITARDNPNNIDWYFFAYGHDYKQALRDFTAVAGKIPLPPRFAFGLWWSRYWDYTDAELRQLVKEFQDHGVPLDVLVIDMGWHKEGWTGYTWDPKCFPDPEGFLKWAREQGLKVTLNLHPADGVGKHEDAFPAMCKHMGLDPATTDRIPFDCTDPRYMAGYFKYLHHPLEAQGIDFWWIDWQQGVTTKIPGLDPLPWLNHLHWQDMASRHEGTEARSHEGGEGERDRGIEGSRKAGEQSDQATGRQSDEGERGDNLASSQSKIQNPKSKIPSRPLLFSRWGGLGNHRYQIGFSGDTYCDWPSLAFQPYFTATAGNVGYAYWSHDIGGHQPGMVDPELYTRWIQWGAFSPILRTHTTKNPKAERRIWEFPEEFYQAMKQAILLRYELQPYIYTMARKCYDEALPLCRPLYYEWPDLDEAYNRPGEYMFGDDLLVAPVTTPRNPQTRLAVVEVWIPPGWWVDWFTGQEIFGPTTILKNVSLTEIPLFARKGAVIPMAPPPSGGSRADSSDLTLRVFPPRNGEAVSEVYEDENSTAAYTEGQFLRTRIHSRVERSDSGKAETFSVTIQPAFGNCASLPTTRNLRIELDTGARILSVKRNSSEVPHSSEHARRSWRWDDGVYDVILPAESLADPCEIEFKVSYDPIASSGEMLVPAAHGLTRLISEIFSEIDAKRRYRSGDPAAEALVTLIKVSQELQEDSIQIPTVAVLEAHASLVREIESLGLSNDRTAELITRLLGVVSDLSVETGETTGSGGVAAIAKLRIAREQTTTLMVPYAPYIPSWVPASARVEITAPKAWQVPGEMTSTSTGAGIEEIRTIRIPLRFVGAPQCGVLGATVEVDEGTYKFRQQLRTSLLPSINAWWVLGPLPPKSGDKFDSAFSKLTKVNPDESFTGKDDKPATWRKVVRELTPGADLTNEFFVNLTPVYGGRIYDSAAYAVTFLKSPQAMPARLAIGSDDGNIVWLNGEKVHEVNLGRAYMSKQDIVPIQLREGINVLVLRIDQQGGDWGFGVHLETPEGEPLTEVEVALDP